MRALVTGGAGFIGSNLAEELLRRGHDVRILDNFSTGKNRPPVETFRADIRNAKEIAPAFSGVDVVFHQAALVSVPRSVKDPVSTTETNINGTLNVLMAARDAGVGKVISASSSSVYGDSETLPKREDMEMRPLSVYASSKVAGEHFCRIFHDLYGMETTSLRYFNVFGPRQDPASEYAAVIPKFIRMLSAGDRPVIYGDGTQTRDFTFVMDVVQANIKASAARGRGRSYNVATGSRVSLSQLVSMLNRIMGTDLKAINEDPRPGDIKHSLADIHRSREDFGYVPSFTLEDGLAKTVEWFREA